MKNTVVVIDLGDLVRYTDYLVAEAQKELVLDHIKPFNAARANRILKEINGKKTVTRKASNRPCEIRVRPIKSTDPDYSEIEQYLMRRV